MRNFFAWIAALLLSVVALSSCEEKKEQPIPVAPEWPDSNHTLLIYMIGDNDLSKWCKENTNNSIKGLLASTTPLNLVVYEDSKASGDGRKGMPVLFRLKRNAEDEQKVDTLYLKKYDNDWDSTNPNVMRQVINDAFSAYNTEVKGLELWSHALGWIPSSKFTPSASREAGIETRASQYIGMDGSSEMDIWELRETLEQCPHLDYIAYDACNMGQAEVAYELKGVADYMLACPTEIMAEGLPYEPMIRSLSTCQNKSNLLPALKAVVDDFAAFYPGNHLNGVQVSNGGTFALTDLHQIQGVHDAYMNLRAVCAERLELLKEHYYTYEDNITHYGRKGMGSRYYFYDLLDAARFLVEDNLEDASYTQLKQALDKAVLKEYHSQGFIEIKDIRSCGLGVALPELFQASTNSQTLQAAYDLLLWSQN